MGPEIIIPIVAVMTFGWLANNWIRAKHGYPLENEWGGTTEKSGSDDHAKALEAKVAQLSDRLEAAEDRVIVLERVVTDKGFVTAAQIEALRDNAPRLENDMRERTT